MAKWRLRISIAISVQKAIGVNCAPFAGQVALAFEWYKKKRVGTDLNCTPGSGQGNDP